MNRAMVGSAVAVALVAVACQRQDAIWFKGDFEAALAVAAERNTLVMTEFYTDWCTWCRRMQKDTFSKPEVRQTFRQIVALRVNAEQGGKNLAKRYGVNAYPTLVFSDAEGDEIDRIIGYLPPDEFMDQASRIMAGDTFVACLQRLSEDPSDQDAIVRAVVGLLERSDPEGAISRIKAFHTASEDHDHVICRRLMFKARSALQDRVYARIARLYRKGWSGRFSAPDTEGTLHLHAVLDGDVATLDRHAQARLLRQARFEDAGDLLSMVQFDEVDHEQLWEIGDFAHRNGHYDLAAEAYGLWYGGRAGVSDASQLNGAAWQLYLSRRTLDTAVEMSRQAWSIQPIANYADTLGRLLYITGAVVEAIEMQRFAAENEVGPRVEIFRDALEVMESGEELEDQPAFETYPDIPKPLSAMRRGTII